MKLQNNGPAVDVGNNNIFSKGEVREFDEAESLGLLSRYPFIAEVKEAKKVVKESIIKKTIKRLKK